MRYWQVQELLCFASGMNSEEADDFCNNDGDYDLLSFNAFGVDFEQFEQIAEALLNFTPLVESPISGDVYHCFADIKNQRAILKSKPVNKAKQND